ncbi:MAG: CD1871A family CXXC motif-containing protein [Clostridia bacterium]
MFKRYGIPALVLLVGVAFLTYGIFNGEVLTVFGKATAICMECIGIG